MACAVDVHALAAFTLAAKEPLNKEPLRRLAESRHLQAYMRDAEIKQALGVISRKVRGAAQRGATRREKKTKTKTKAKAKIGKSGSGAPQVE